MLEKKLLTLGCAMGILACGACFYPPPGGPPAGPPLPPLRPRVRINLDGSRRILVRVTNVSETHHVDPVPVGSWIAESINTQSEGDAPIAIAGNETTPWDAVLQVSIVKESASETATQSPAGTSREAVQLNIDATLTLPDGTVVWRETNRPYRSGDWGLLANSADPWSPANLGHWIHYYVCRTIVSQAFYGGR